MVLFTEQSGSYRPLHEVSDLETPDGNDSSADVPPPRWGYLKPKLTYLNIYLALVTTLLCVLVSIDISFRRQHESFSSTVASGKDNSEFSESTYGWNPEYMTLSHKNDYLWEEDLKGGEDKVVELGEDGPTLYDVYGQDIGSPASISMFHQLHCLAAFRKALQDSREGIDVGMSWRDNGHWPHCFDYMRKTIMCWADFTLEQPQQLRNGSSAFTIDGVMTPRRCRSTQPIYDFLSSHEAYNIEEQEEDKDETA